MRYVHLDWITYKKMILFVFIFLSFSIFFLYCGTDDDIYRQKTHIFFIKEDYYFLTSYIN